MSPASTPASFSAASIARSIRASTSMPSWRPKGVCAQPTIQPVMTRSSLMSPSSLSSGWAQAFQKPHRLAQRRLQKLILAHHHMAAQARRLGPAPHLAPVEGRPSAAASDPTRADIAPGLQLDQYNIRVVAPPDPALPRDVVDPLRP